MSSAKNITSKLHRVLLTASVTCCGWVAAGRLTAQTEVTPAMHYFTSARPQQSVYHGPAPQAAAVTPTVSQQPAKPFEYVQRSSSITPYVNLDLLESSTGIPNYYTFVKPHLEQRERLEAQSRELQRLHRQARIQGQQVPTTAARYGTGYRDLKSYYPALNR